MPRIVIAFIGAATLVLALATPTAVAAEPASPIEPSFDRTCNETPIDVTRGVVRVSGSDRYQTAIAVSRLRFADRQGCVISVASGRDFPDALTAAANIRFGPLLLVPGTALPSSVRTEIARLDPFQIETYGGRGVLTPTVMGQLSAFADGRIISNGGANRYGTAMVATFDHPTGTVAYVATGADFPDALAAVPLIRASGGSFLLVERNGVPAETRRALGYLKPSRIVIIGGTGVVTDVAARALRPFTTGTVTRISGADRFETAVNISQTSQPIYNDTVMIVSGQSFADALSASGLAAGPILLVEPDSIPEVVRDRLAVMQPNKIIIVGGPASVSFEVEAELEQYLRPAG